MFFKYQKDRFSTHQSSLITLHLTCVLCLVSSVLSGCSTVKKIQHLSQLLTIKRYSDGQDQITRDVTAQNKMFDEMIVEIGRGGFNYKTAEEVFDRFGEPIFARDTEYQGVMTEQWLYRYAKDFKNEHGKVYCYFDDEGKLINFDYIKRD